VLGAVIERREDHLEALRLLRPGFDLAAERRARAASGVPDEIRPGDLYPDALPCLAAVSELGYLVGVVGNTSAEMERFLRDHCDADFVASSAGLGAAKPDPAFFAAIAGLAGLAPGQIAYVGDRVDNDVRPAAAAGLTAIFLRRGPWGWIQALDGDPPEAAATVESLEALPATLARLARLAGGERATG
jgi:FMN phosphatase YigB (HAD superfamily)